tara:strand:- start:1181 stop:1828 length:648 start_codon:yes stop_codon:yes gene_type:complete
VDNFGRATLVSWPQHTVSTLQWPKGIYTETNVSIGLGNDVRGKQALTTGEVAKYCGVNFRTVIRWIERGHLDAYKLPGRGDNRIPLPGFINFLQSNQMPVPDELRGQSRTLLILAEPEELAAELASSARRAGWEPLVAGDAMQFGYCYAEQQPSAMVVSSEALVAAVNRIRREGELQEMLCILAGADVAGGVSSDGWYRLHWPTEQKRFVSLLDL